MGWFSSLGAKLIGGGIGQAAEDVSKAIDRFVETPEEKKAAALLLKKAEQNPDKWQAEINKVQAAHRSVFIAGPRPFMMWVCAIGMACHFIVFPVAEWVALLMGHPVPMPEVNWGELMTLTLGLLGLSGLRSYEKKNKLTI